VYVLCRLSQGVERVWKHKDVDQGDVDVCCNGHAESKILRNLGRPAEVGWKLA